MRHKKKTEVNDNNVDTDVSIVATVVTDSGSNVVADALPPVYPSNDGNSCLDDVVVKLTNKTNIVYNVSETNDEDDCAANFEDANDFPILNAKCSHRMTIAHVFVLNYNTVEEECQDSLDMVNNIKAMFEEIHPRADIRPFLETY